MNNYERGKYEEGTKCAAALIKVIDRAAARLRASGNYVANKEVEPTKVTFANGRTVKIEGNHLVIGWDKPRPKE